MAVAYHGVAEIVVDVRVGEGGGGRVVVVA